MLWTSWMIDRASRSWLVRQGWPRSDGGPLAIVVGTEGRDSGRAIVDERRRSRPQRGPAASCHAARDGPDRSTIDPITPRACAEPISSTVRPPSRGPVGIRGRASSPRPRAQARSGSASPARSTSNRRATRSTPPAATRPAPLVERLDVADVREADDAPDHLGRREAERIVPDGPLPGRTASRP